MEDGLDSLSLCTLPYQAQLDEYFPSNDGFDLDKMLNDFGASISSAPSLHLEPASRDLELDNSVAIGTFSMDDEEPPMKMLHHTLHTHSTTSSAHNEANRCTLRKFYCHFEGCGKSFTTSGHAARHNRIHTGERRFLCPVADCGARFSRQDNCNQHAKTHDHGKHRLSRRSSTRTTSGCPSDHEDGSLKHLHQLSSTTASDSLRRALSVGSKTLSPSSLDTSPFTRTKSVTESGRISIYPVDTHPFLLPTDYVRKDPPQDLHFPQTAQLQPPPSLGYSSCTEEEDSWHFLSDGCTQQDQDWQFFTAESTFSDTLGDEQAGFGTIAATQDLLNP